MKPNDSTIDRNGNGGDAGVADKRNAILAQLAKMKSKDGAAGRSGKNVPGGQKPQ